VLETAAADLRVDLHRLDLRQDVPAVGQDGHSVAQVAAEFARSTPAHIDQGDATTTDSPFVLERFSGPAARSSWPMPLSRRWPPGRLERPFPGSPARRTGGWRLPDKPSPGHRPS
jgi:hypothetical protein